MGWSLRDPSTVTVLAIDDSQDVLKVLARCFAKQTPPGLFKFYSCADFATVPPEAGSPDVLLLDLHLENIGGTAVVERARSIWPSVPIIVLTGQPRGGHVVDVYAAGADDYLYKADVLAPSKFAEILKAIDRALGRRGRAEDASTIRRHAVDLGEKSVRSTVLKYIAVVGPLCGLLTFAVTTGFCAPPWDTQRISAASAKYETKAEAETAHQAITRDIADMKGEQKEQRGLLNSLNDNLIRLMSSQGVRPAKR